ncbi:hypothetical protein ACHAXN_007966 [Cyclotella atomus]
MKLSPTALAVLLAAPTTLAFAPIRQSYRTALRPLHAEDSSPDELPAKRSQEDAAYDYVAQNELKVLATAIEQDIPLSKAYNYDTPEEARGYAIEQKVRAMGLDPEEIKIALGVTSIADINPNDPNMYIRHRPGKYGWTPPQLTPEAQKVHDENLLQELTPEERDLNWQDHKKGYNGYVESHKFPNPLRAEAAYKLYVQSYEADPWYDLNERLEDAVMYDDQDSIDYLKPLIEKVGGPPNCLKDKLTPEGYVSSKDIYGLTLVSNERLKEMIEAEKFNQFDESSRQYATVRKLEDIEWKKEVESEEFKKAEADYIKKEQEWNRRMELAGFIMGNREVDFEEWEEKREEAEMERQELLQQWKELGKEKTPEETFWDMDERKKVLSETFNKVAAENRRKDTLFTEEEEIQFDEFGTPIVDPDFFKSNRPMTNVEKYMEALKYDANGNLRPIGDEDVFNAELDPDTEINEGSSCTSGPLTVDVNSCYNAEQSDPQARKHTFQYTVRITNNSEKDTVQLLSRKFFIQPLMNKYKDVVEGQGVTGRQPILKPGEVFEYTSTAPLNTRPISSTIIAARMSGEYRYCTLKEGQETATEEQINGGQGEAAAQLGMFHFVFPEDQRVKVTWTDEDDDDEDDDDASPTVVYSKQPARSAPRAAQDAQTVPKAQANTLPGDPDMTSGNIAGTPNQSSDTVSSDVRVVVTTKFLPERSDKDSNKFTFAYNVRISNEKKDQAIQLVSRRFEIQNIGSQTRDVVQGANVTGRQPVLKPGENFEYTSTAPLFTVPMLDKTRVLSRMSGEFNCVLLADDGVTPLSSTPLKAELGTIHFVLPEDQ